jgi:hypothetical protein
MSGRVFQTQRINTAARSPEGLMELLAVKPGDIPALLDLFDQT